MGGELAKLSEETLESLNRLLPPHWSHNNPVDILGDAGPERFGKAVEIVSRDPNSDGLLVILTPLAMTDPTQTAERLAACAKLDRKPVLASWMGGAQSRRGRGNSQSGQYPHLSRSRYRGARLPLHVAVQLQPATASMKHRRWSPTRQRNAGPLGGTGNHSGRAGSRPDHAYGVRIETTARTYGIPTVDTRAARAKMRPSRTGGRNRISGRAEAALHHHHPQERMSAACT